MNTVQIKSTKDWSIRWQQETKNSGVAEIYKISYLFVWKLLVSTLQIYLGKSTFLSIGTWETYDGANNVLFSISLCLKNLKTKSNIF